MCFVRYGRKWDKENILSSNLISWKYITVIILQPLRFLFKCFCLQLLPFRSFSSKDWRTNDEHRTTNRSEIFRSISENSLTSTSNVFGKCMEITPYRAHVCCFVLFCFALFFVLFCFFVFSGTRDSKWSLRRWYMVPGARYLQTTGLKSTSSE